MTVLSCGYNEVLKSNQCFVWALSVVLGSLGLSAEVLLHNRCMRWHKVVKKRCSRSRALLCEGRHLPAAAALECLLRLPAYDNPLAPHGFLQETQSVPIFIKDGQGLHRDLCFVSRVMRLGEMESFKLPGDLKSGGAMFYVRLQVVRIAAAACVILAFCNAVAALLRERPVVLKASALARSADRLFVQALASQPLFPAFLTSLLHRLLYCWSRSLLRGPFGNRQRAQEYMCPFCANDSSSSSSAVLDIEDKQQQQHERHTRCLDNGQLPSPAGSARPSENHHQRANSLPQPPAARRPASPGKRQGVPGRSVR